MNWLKRLLGGKRTAAEPSAAASPATADPWDRSALAVAELAGPEAARALAAIHAADAGDAVRVAEDFGVDVVAPEYLLQCATRDLLIEHAGMTYLDWKSGLEDARWGLEQQLGRHDLAPLTDAEKTMLETVEPMDTQVVTFVTFPDLYHPFDMLAQRRGRRILAYDEKSDSYAFLMVTPALFERWAGTSLSAGHEFPKDTSFEKRKTE